MSVDGRDVVAIGREWAEREWSRRAEFRLAERWHPPETEALALLGPVPAEHQAELASIVITAAVARWLELLGNLLAGPDEDNVEPLSRGSWRPSR